MESVYLCMAVQRLDMGVELGLGKAITPQEAEPRDRMSSARPQAPTGGERGVVEDVPVLKVGLFAR